jgi:hypothetical protein
MAKLPSIYTRTELAQPDPLLPKPGRPVDPRQLPIPPRIRPERKDDEGARQQAIRLRLAKERDLVLWRHSASRPMADAEGNFFRAGLPAGCPDLVGILLPRGRAFFIEVKGSHRDACTCKTCERQNAFHALIRKFGGFVAKVRSEDDAVAALNRARMGMND